MKRGGVVALAVSIAAIALALWVAREVATVWALLAAGPEDAGPGSAEAGEAAAAGEEESAAPAPPSDAVEPRAWCRLGHVVGVREPVGIDPRLAAFEPALTRPPLSSLRGFRWIEERRFELAPIVAVDLERLGRVTLAPVGRERNRIALAVEGDAGPRFEFRWSEGNPLWIVVGPGEGGEDILWLLCSSRAPAP